MIKTFLKKHWLIAIGIAAGVLGGYFLWVVAGCSGQNNPITSSPINSSLWGAAMGGLLFNIFNGKAKSNNNK